MSKSFIAVFSIDDKSKLEKQGLRFICRQFYEGKMAFLFEDNNKLSFELEGMKHIRTNKLMF